MTDQVRADLQKTLGSTYTLERELGGGGMSRVFVAEETALGRKVAVKVLPSELTAGVNVERFNREILVAAKLQHPHIVPVLTAGEMNGLPYYTMPFVEGESLRARLARTNALSITDAIGVLRDVAKALAYAHERGIVHRDIKPDNVLLTGGSATVTDFGIAKAISAARAETPGGTLTQVGTSIGTPTYMSPEQASGDPDTDQRTDLYSFGCMAYELLTGRPPFTETTPRKLLAAHMAERPKPVSDLRVDTPPELAALVMQCLEKEADHRPQSASDVVRILETVTSGGTQPAMPGVLLSGKGMLRKALAVYAVAFVAVAILARAAIVGIGLPDWVFPGSLVVMALGLPVILWTAYVHRVTRRAVTTTPTFTPGGTPSLAHGTIATIAIKASPHVSWRRTTLGGIWALSAFVLLVGAFMAMRALGIGPAASLLSSGKFDSKDAVLLADFRTTNTDSTIGRVVSEAVRQGLSESSVISLAAPGTITAALARMQREPGAKLDSALARNVAVREGIKAILDGDVAGVGTGYIVTLRLVRADSGIVLASVNAAGEGSQGLIDAADKAARALRSKAGESLRRVHATPALAQVTTTSLEALKKYTAAFRANAVEGEYVRSIALAREAVAIDSNFAMAWRLMGVVSTTAGMGVAVADSAYERAFALRQRLPTRERLWTEVNVYRSARRRDRVRSIAAAESAIALGATSQDTAVFGNYVGNDYRSRRDYARADTAYARATRAAYGGSFQWTNRIGVLVDAGRLADARQVAERAREKYPVVIAAQTRPFELLYHSGEIDALRHAADSLLNGGTAGQKSWAGNVLAMLAIRGGRLRQGLGRTPETPRDTTTPTFGNASTLAIMEVSIRDSSRAALQMLDRAMSGRSIKALPDVARPYFAMANAYAIAGNPARARAIMADFDRDITDTSYKRASQPGYHSVLGEILLAEKKYADALREFRRGDSLPDGPASACGICLWSRLGRTFDAAGQADSAIVMYERYITTPYWDRTGVQLDATLLARTHLRLAELYEAKKNNAKAVEHYEKFAELWKNADPELQPRVTLARQRAAALRAK